MGEIETHLKVLEERVRDLRMKNFDDASRYNATEKRRILNKIKKAKKEISEASFI